MLQLFLGTDREKARTKMNVAVTKAAKGAEVVRISDASNTEDLRTVLRGPGMFTPLEAEGSLMGFGGKRVLVFEGVCVNPELVETFLESLEKLAKSDEAVFVYEEKPLAELRRKIEKHAKSVEKFDAPKKERDTSIFKVADALRSADKKALWVTYMNEIAKGSAPEAVHGILFWAAKDMLLKAGTPAVRARASHLVAKLAELPHEARRRGEDVEYALERFVLTIR